MRYDNRKLIDNPDTTLQRKYNQILRVFKNSEILAEFNNCYGTTIEIVFVTNDEYEYIRIYDTYEHKYYMVSNPKALTFWTNPKTKKKAILDINTFYFL